MYVLHGRCVVVCNGRVTGCDSAQGVAPTIAHFGGARCHTSCPCAPMGAASTQAHSGCLRQALRVRDDSTPHGPQGHSAERIQREPYPCEARCVMQNAQRVLCEPCLCVEPWGQSSGPAQLTVFQPVKPTQPARNAISSLSPCWRGNRQFSVRCCLLL